MNSKILLVDDDPDVLASTSALFSDTGYSVTACSSADEALESIKGNKYDVVLSDIKMPEISGIDLLEQAHKIDSQLPVILITAYADLNTAVDAISRGAFDFIIKSSAPEYILHSIQKAVEHKNYLKLRDNHKRLLEDTVRQRTAELEAAKTLAGNFSDDLVKRLTTVAEFRDTEAIAHVARIGIYSAMIAGGMGMSADFVNTIKRASPLHDIGKIGITDYILFKLQPLTPEEFEVVKSHTTQGKRILSGSSNPIIKMAESIALNHHERWDGSGYPNRLRGEEIPVEGRIVILADQYDSIRSERIYKPGYSHEETYKIITEGDGRTSPRHFDPEVLRTFVKLSPEFNEIYRLYED